MRRAFSRDNDETPRSWHTRDAPSLDTTLVYAAAFTSSWNGVRIGGINLTDLLIVTAVLAVASAAIRNRRRLPTCLWTLPLLFLLVCSELVRSAATGNSLVSAGVIGEWRSANAIGQDYQGPLVTVTRLAISLFAVTFIVVGVSESKTAGNVIVKKIVAWWLAGIVASGSFAVVATFAPQLNDLPFRHRLYTDRVSGLTGHPNHLGMALAIALPLLIYTVVSGRGLGRRIAILSVPVVAYALLLTGSRLAFAGAAVLATGTGVYFIFKTRSIPVSVLLVAPFAAVLASAAIPAALSRTRFGTENAALSNEGKIDSLREAWEHFSSSPVVGIGLIPEAFTSSTVTLAAYGGLVLVIAYYLTLIYPIIVRPRPLDGMLAPILVITAIGVLLYGLAGNLWLDRFLYWPFAALYALSLYSKQVAVDVRGRGAELLDTVGVKGAKHGEHR